MVFQNIFDKTYIINLPERIDRKHEIQAELKSIGSDLITGKVELFPAIKPHDYGDFPSQGVLGCFLSHLQVLKLAREENLKNVLIIEDDLAISRRIRRISSILPDFLNDRDWDIIFLGFLPYCGLDFSDYYSKASVKSYDSNKIYSIEMTDKPVRGTHFYVVRQSMYTPLIVYLENLLNERFQASSLVSLPVLGDLDAAYLDTAYFLFKRKAPDTNISIICPPLGWQRSSRSDVHPSRFDRLIRLPFILRAYRGIKSVIKKYMESANPFFFSQ